jgi:hypothetical protein
VAELTPRSTNRRSGWPAAVGAALVVTLTACGSTVQQTGTTAGQGLGAQPGLTASNGTPAGAAAGGGGLTPSSGSPTGSAGVEAQPGANSQHPAGGTDAAGGGTTGSGAGAAGSTGGSVVTVGPGITATTINLGLQYTKDAAQNSSQFGAAGASPGDFRAYYDPVIKYINGHGGVAGRKLVPYYYGIDPQAAGGIQAEDSASCAFWTQDHKVFMISGGRDNLNACAEKHNGVSMSYGNETARTFATFPHYLDPISFRLERIGGLTVRSLAKRKYFTGKFGLVTWDDPNYRLAVQNGYAPALRAAHVTTVDTTYIPVPQAYGDLGSSNAAISNAILKFASEGIDHVVVQDGPAGLFAGTGLTLQWLNNAESQHYRPRYGMNTYNSPGSQALPATQQANMLYVGWSDLTASGDAGYRTNTTREACYKIMTDAGVTLTSSNQNVAAVICDSLFLFQRVGNRPGGLTANGFIQQAEQVGSYPVASVYGASLGPGKHDGGDLVRDGHFDSGCVCGKLDGPPYRAGS